MKKILLSLTAALCLPAGLYAEDATVATQPTVADVKQNVAEIITELRGLCEKIVVATQASLTIEEAMKQLQQREQELLTRFMTRGFTKDKFETLGKKISTMCMDKQEHAAIVTELMKNPAHKIITNEVELLVSLVEDLYDVMVKAAAVQNFVKELLGTMQTKVDTLMACGYTEEQVTKLVQDMIAEISQEMAEATQKNNGDNA